MALVFETKLSHAWVSLAFSNVGKTLFNRQTVYRKKNRSRHSHYWGIKTAKNGMDAYKTTIWFIDTSYKLNGWGFLSCQNACLINWLYELSLTYHCSCHNSCPWPPKAYATDSPYGCDGGAIACSPPPATKYSVGSSLNWRLKNNITFPFRALGPPSTCNTITDK